MLTLFTIHVRTDGISPETFRTRWHEDHAAAVQAAPEDAPPIRRHVQNHALPALYEGGAEPAFDGISELWFDDWQAVRAWLGHPYDEDAVAPDEAAFLDRTRSRSFVTQPTVIDVQPPGEDAIKAVTVLNRKEDVSLAEFHRYWRQDHARIVESMDVWETYVNHYVQHHAINEADPSVSAPHDGVVEMWFDDLADRRALSDSEEYWNVGRADGETFIGDLESVAMKPVEIV